MSCQHFIYPVVCRRSEKLCMTMQAFSQALSIKVLFFKFPLSNTLSSRLFFRSSCRLFLVHIIKSEAFHSTHIKHYIDVWRPRQKCPHKNTQKRSITLKFYLNSNGTYIPRLHILLIKILFHEE